MWLAETPLLSAEKEDVLGCSAIRNLRRPMKSKYAFILIAGCCFCFVLHPVEGRSAIHSKPHAEADCNEAHAHFLRAEALLESREYYRSIDEFDRSIEPGCDDALSFAGKALAYSQIGKGDLAIAAYSQAIRLRPTNPEFYFNRGLLYNDAEQFESAIADFSQAIRLAPQMADAYDSRAIAFARIGRDRAALRDFDKSVKLDPSSAIYLNNRGRFRLMGKNFNGAIDDLGKALHLQPDFPDALENRAAAYEAQQQYSAAIVDLTKLVQLKRDDADAWMRRGVIYSKMARHADAISDFSEAIRLRADSSDALNSRCWERAISGTDLQGALRDCDSALNLAPNDSRIVDSRGLVELRLGQYREAVQDFDAYLVKKPKSAIQLFLRGVARSKMGDVAGGRKDMQSALQLDGKVAQQAAKYGVNADAP